MTARTLRGGGAGQPRTGGGGDPPLDEGPAAVIGGELHDPIAIGSCCCNMIIACERARDFDRAGHRRPARRVLRAHRPAAAARALPGPRRHGPASAGGVGAGRGGPEVGGRRAPASAPAGRLRPGAPRASCGAGRAAPRRGAPAARRRQASTCCPARRRPRSAGRRRPGRRPRPRRPVPARPFRRAAPFEITGPALRAARPIRTSAWATSTRHTRPRAPGGHGRGCRHGRAAGRRTAGGRGGGAGRGRPDGPRTCVEDAVDRYEALPHPFEAAQARAAQRRRPTPGASARPHLRAAKPGEGEGEVLALVAEGLSNREVAERLDHERTHRAPPRRNIYMRLGVSSRAAASPSRPTMGERASPAKMARSGDEPARTGRTPTA